MRPSWCIYHNVACSHHTIGKFSQVLYEGLVQKAYSMMSCTLILRFLQAEHPPRDFLCTLREINGRSSPSVLGVSILKVDCIFAFRRTMSTEKQVLKNNST